MEMEKCLETLKSLSALQNDAVNDLAHRLSELFNKISQANVRLYDSCACEEISYLEFDVDDEGQLCITTHYV